MSYQNIKIEDLPLLHNNNKTEFQISINRSKIQPLKQQGKSTVLSKADQVFEEIANLEGAHYGSIFGQRSFASLQRINDSNHQANSKWQQTIYEDEQNNSLIQDFWIVLKLAVPPVISMFFQFFVQLINTYYIGHLNDQVIMAGIGMGNMLINILCFAVTQGLNSALETFISQSFGATNYSYCGVLLNRGRLIVSVFLIPIILIFVVSDKLLIYIGQDAQIAEISKQFSLMMMPGIWAMTQFDVIRKYMIAQRQNTIPVYIQFFTMILHFGWCHLFISVYEWSVFGAALATNITYLLNLIIIDHVLAKSQKFQFTRAPLDRSIFQEWSEYLRIGIPGAFMLCFEWWAFEFLAIFSGYISVASLAAEIVIINIVSFIFMMPLGISYAASSLTGYYVGQGNIKRAKRFAFVIMLLNIILTIFVLALIVIFNEQISRLFTHEEEIVEIVNKVLWIIVIYIFFDTIHGVQSGIIKGIGKQTYSSIFLLICYYCFGMPLALVFAFKLQMEVSGLWLGFTIASMILDVGFYFIINCTQWELAGKDMRKRSMTSEIQRIEMAKSIQASKHGNDELSQPKIFSKQLNSIDGQRMSQKSKYKL
ncbi:na+-driven multidrug efflux pump [Stylonychia lemnae]|uniref:Na+-driven multidrug efflux pump n=1 Tax=Stylonychia lemnae TaxID=5949 RepID=A0A078AEG2_STYLE|nr:na+-driven multidrug efflux pump [Stylonychia lemnae]|eukprot:CDW80600.1 na+-driven multidrug efflux pump [Stylonychia lemnae]